jgi:exonuclease SbcD
MRVLHTGDWHLGCQLNNHKRLDEQRAFLDWLAETIANEEIDVLLLCGDVFDSPYPSNETQKLYYQFLKNNRARHTVIIAGNHDSVGGLEAPKTLLEYFNVHVAGKIDMAAPEKQLLHFHNGNDRLVVAAVPYLRERDLVTGGKASGADFLHNLQEAAVSYYNTLIHTAQRRWPGVPLILTGHLSAYGFLGQDDEALGTLNSLPAENIEPSYAYFALGHIHTAQALKFNRQARYAGAPLPVSFGESNHKVVLVFDSISGNIRELAVPLSKKLLEITGSMTTIETSLNRLKAEGEAALLKITYTGSAPAPHLRRDVLNMLDGQNRLEAVIIRNNFLLEHVLLSEKERAPDLAALNEEEVFKILLNELIEEPSEREAMHSLFKKALQAVADEEQP